MKQLVEILLKQSQLKCKLRLKSF